MAKLNFRLSTSRTKQTSVPNRNIDDEVSSDQGRIIPSSAFRRLQSKTQVFSLEENASVRTRLTHSLEVAYCGKLLARLVFSKLRENRPADVLDISEFAFTSTVENACLLHDIGNPPFGHFGEFTIRSWFVENKSAFNLGEDGNKRYYLGFENFDGNAQGFRIITRLSSNKDENGLNLTCSLLATYLKYLDSIPMESEKFKKKIGFFETEREIVVKAWQELGMSHEGEMRHPLTFLMEAADDISYCMSDIEDGIEKGIIRWSDVKDFVCQNIKDLQGESGSIVQS